MTGPSRSLDATLRYNFADVRNCIDHAKQLRRASRLRPATIKAGLLELALEEVGKGGLLCLRILARRRTDDPIPTLSSEGEALKQALIDIASENEVLRIKEAYDLTAFLEEVNLDEVFERHPPKLAAVNRLSRIVRVSRKVVLTHSKDFLEAMEAAPKLMKRLRALSPKSMDKFEALGEIRKADYLADLRERAFYVNLDKRRHSTVPPSVSAREVRDLKWALDAALALVEGWMVLYQELVVS